MNNGSSKSASNTASSCGKEKNRRKAPVKIVLRRLPAAMTWEQLETQLNPIPQFEFAEFIAAKSSGGISFSRAYFVFKDENEIVTFKDRFHGYVFVDNQGGESVGIVELAPNSKVPRDKLEAAKDRDFKCGTVETDHEYKKFLSEREHPQKSDPIPVEQLIREIDEREKMAEKNAVQETPLTQFIIKKNEERFKRIEEKRRIREEEKRARMERRYESEARERKDAKKVTEFRNSKFERIREAPAKEKERMKGRAFRSGDYSRNGTVEKENKRYDDDRDKRAQSPKKGRDTSANRDSFPRKTRHSDGSGNWKADKMEEAEKKKEASKDDEIASKKDIEVKDATESKSTKSGMRVSKMIINRTTTTKSASAAAEKDSESADRGVEKEKRMGKVEREAPVPRRNKDRPERAIYQPGAARRRAAALAAAGSNATGSTAATTKEKP